MTIKTYLPGLGFSPMSAPMSELMGIPASTSTPKDSNIVLSPSKDARQRELAGRIGCAIENIHLLGLKDDIVPPLLHTSQPKLAFALIWRIMHGCDLELRLAPREGVCHLALEGELYLLSGLIGYSYLDNVVSGIVARPVMSPISMEGSIFDISASTFLGVLKMEDIYEHLVYVSSSK